jgi:hypothetical protein
LGFLEALSRKADFKQVLEVDVATFFCFFVLSAPPGGDYQGR